MASKRNLVGFLVVAAAGAEGSALGAVGEGAVVLSQSVAIGYAVPYAALTAIKVATSIVPRKRQPTHQHRAVETTGTAVSGCEGRWILDTERSESLTPFLIAVGAPRLIAKMVGSKGKPMEIVTDGEKVTIRIEGKEAELIGPGKTDVTTPRGTVCATLSKSRGRDGWTSFRVVKHGPADGEVVTEERELVEGGRVLRCVFTHSRVGEPKVTVVRWYVRG